MKSIFTVLLMALVPLVSLSQSGETCNCCSEDQMAFDFWVGEWEVTNPNGNRAGSNTLEKIQNGCVLRENWISNTAGYTGTSYNFYNLNTAKWEQIWVDNQGQSLHLSGNRKGNQMILESESQKNANGQSFFHRVTWTKNEDGTVRQLWETFTEGTEQPSVAFDGLYRKKED